MIKRKKERCLNEGLNSSIRPKTRNWITGSGSGSTVSILHFIHHHFFVSVLYLLLRLVLGIPDFHWFLSFSSRFHHISIYISSLSIFISISLSHPSLSQSHLLLSYLYLITVLPKELCCRRKRDKEM